MAKPLLTILVMGPVHGLGPELLGLSGMSSFCMEKIPRMEGENLK